MVNRTYFLFLVLLVGLLLVACGGGGTGGPAATDQDSGDSDTGGTAATDQDGGVRVKEDSALGSAPGLLEASAVEGPADRGATGATSDVAGVCLSAPEGDLARMINEYRATRNLPPLQISKSLSLVAQQHAWDTVTNRNAWPAPPEGKTCNLHSWSDVVNPALQQGTWTANCYTSDHANAQGMWNKPGQIAGFPGEGVENSFASGGTATASGALTAWQNSPGHNNVITQQGGWGPMASMGVGMSGGIAHLWLSGVSDPEGEAQLCSGGSITQPTATATTEEPTATSVPPTATSVPPTATSEPPTATLVPPTATNVPPTATPDEPDATPDEPTATPEESTATPEPPTATTEPPAATPEPSTATTEPPAATPEPPTATPEPPAATSTTAAPTGTILNENGTIAAGGTAEHSFDVAQGRTYIVVVSPSAEFDVDPTFNCSLSGGGGASGGFDWYWEGEPETFSYTPPAGNGTCRITVGGYGGSTGTYTITVTAQ